MYEKPQTDKYNVLQFTTNYSSVQPCTGNRNNDIPTNETLNDEL